MGRDDAGEMGKAAMWSRVAVIRPRREIRAASCRDPLRIGGPGADHAGDLLGQRSRPRRIGAGRVQMKEEASGEPRRATAAAKPPSFPA